MTEKQMYDKLVAAGMTPAGAAGALGNGHAESGLNPANLQNTYERKLGMTDAQYTAAVDAGTYTNFDDDRAGYGIFQWTYPTRKRNLHLFAKNAGKSIGDPDMQLDFFLKELRESYAAVWKVLTTTSSVREASDAMLLKFERPKDQSVDNQLRRAGYSQTFFDKYAKAAGAPAVSEPKPSAAAVIAVAVGQIGYMEKASKSQLDNPTANAGSANWTKYARDFDEKYPNWYNGKKNGYAWCDMFVDWCFLTSFGYQTALSLLCQPEKSAGAGCRYSLNYYKAKGQFHTSGPQPGDQIFFGTSLTNVAHTGLVERSDGQKVYTIEGNTSDRVARRTYYLTDKSILGYGRPAFESVEAPAILPAPVTPPAATTPAPAATTKIDAAHRFDKAVAGAYKTTTELNLRAGSSTTKTVLAVMPKGATVRNYGYYNTAADGTVWLYVQYVTGGKTLTGFCSSKYLRR